MFGQNESVNGTTPYDDHVQLDNIPTRLRALPQWVLWKTIIRGGKPTKVPFQTNGSAAKANDPTTWTTLAAASEAMSGYSGLGFEFSANDPFCGVDLDGCRNPETGEIAEWAQQIIRLLATYSEVSPSKSGVKLFIRAKSPFATGKKKGLDFPKVSDKGPAIEIYDHARYFAVTGWRLSGLSNEPEQRQRELEEIIGKYFLPTDGASQSDFRSDAAVIERARKYIGKRPPAVSGQDGHGRTFHAACVLVLGFELSEADALTLMQEYNGSCQPPWSEKELLHKVRSAAKQPGERGYLRNAKPGSWSRIRVPTYQGPADTPPSGEMIVDVIHTYFRQRYDPTFRRGPNVWSNALCREISRAEACAAPASTIIPGLLAATDFPRGEAGPKRSAIPGAYRQWAPFAWADLLSCLPDEADSPEIAESAADEFNASVSELMLTIEAMAYVHRNHGNQTERSEIQRRSLIHWAQLFAKPGPWKPIRSLALWCRIGEDGGLCVAIHQRLFAQMRRGSLAAYTHRRFVQLAEMYGVGVASRTATTRFVELTSQFLSGLISAPDDGPGDGTDDDASHARSAHRTSSSPSSSSSSKEGVKG